MKKGMAFVFALGFLLCDCICLENIKEVSNYFKEEGYTTNYSEPFEGTTFIDLTNQKETITIIVVDGDVTTIEYYNHSNYTSSCHIDNMDNKSKSCIRAKTSLFDYSGFTKKELKDYAQYLYDSHCLYESENIGILFP